MAVHGIVHKHRRRRSINILDEKMRGYMKKALDTRAGAGRQGIHMCVTRL